MRLLVLIFYITIAFTAQTLGSPISTNYIQTTVLYNVTDLGAENTPPTFVRLADGTVTSVIVSNGTQLYQFNKMPVQSVYEKQQSSTDDYYVTTMRVNGHSTGYGVYFGAEPSNGPVVFGASSGWNGVPSDLNSSGQFVGSAHYPDPSYALPGQYYWAAFSTPTGANHGFTAYVSDNLNYYIPNLPDGAWLTSAFAISDSGQILTLGNDGHDYLLTPLSLGIPAPTPVPEPTTTIIFGMMGGALVIRSLRRKTVSESTD